VLGAARWLTAAASGAGTHEQLGLPRCGFLAWFEIPCPACGLTTAFAHLARCEFVRAVQVHPLGVPLFFLTLALLPVSLWGIARRASIVQVVDRVEADRWALYLVLAALVVWGIRLTC